MFTIAGEKDTFLRFFPKIIFLIKKIHNKFAIETKMFLFYFRENSKFNLFGRKFVFAKIVKNVKFSKIFA
jgi:hypothetical protein